MNVVVTGASRGIGKAVMNEFARLGHEVIGLTRGGDQEEVEVKGSGKAVLRHFDWEEIAISLERVEFSNGGKVDILINNAATIVVKPWDEITREEHLYIYKVNVLYPLELIRVMISTDRMAPEAHIVNVSSMGGVQGSAKFPGLLGYSMTKSALINMTEALAVELPDQLSVNCLALGAVNTEMLRKAFPHYISSINDVAVAEFICSFALSNKGIVNGKLIPVAKSDPN